MVLSKRKMEKDHCSGKELLLIGTVHNDPDGHVRLLELLRTVNPSVVMVEASPYGLAYRQRYGRRLRRRLGRRLKRLSRSRGFSWKAWGQVHGLFEKVRMPFEYRSSLRFCRGSGADCRFIDLSSYSRRLIVEQWREMFNRDNLAALLSEPPEDLRSSVRRTYASASRLLVETDRRCIDPYVQEWGADFDWQEREAHLAEMVKRYFDRLSKGRLAYVGGWQHLIYPTSVGTLCDRLADLHPQRVLLDCQKGSIPLVI